MIYLIKNSEEKKDQINRTIIRNSFYITAEVLKNEYNEKCDLWSCRVI